MNSIILILADDFTGALDTGVQFAKCGAVTKVTTDLEYDFAGMDGQVLVIDTETRHLSSDEAASIVSGVVTRARRCGIRFFYKKTDSAMRGNVGAELEALLRASGGALVHFLPAFPAMGRAVREGTLYVKGVPVAESVFRKDPFEPVTRSEVAAILAQQTDLPVSVRDGIGPGLPSEGILVYNAQTNEQMDALTAGLDLEDRIVLVAGCAGLAASMCRLISFEDADAGSSRRHSGCCREDGLLMVSGSVNQVTLRQIEEGKKAGFGYRRLNNGEKLTDHLQSREGAVDLDVIFSDIERNRHFIIDTSDAPGEETAAQWGAEHGLSIREVGSIIAETLAFTVSEVLARGIRRNLLLTGGDVLFHTMQRMGITALEPLEEVSAGVILTRFSYRGRDQYVLTKSGGFGDEQLLIRMGQAFDHRE